MIAPTINAEFAEIFEGLEGWERLKSLPEAEQEAFIESLTVDALEEGIPVTAEEIVNPGEAISQTENLPVEEPTERGIIKKRNGTSLYVTKKKVKK